MREMSLSEAWDDGHKTGVRDQKKAEKELLEAVYKFIDKIRQIEDDPKYKAVWVLFSKELMALEQQLNKEINNGRQSTETNKEV